MITAKPDNQLKSPFRIDRSFLRSTHTANKIHYFSDTKNRGDGYELLLDGKSSVTSPDTESAPFRQLVHVSTDGDFGTERSRIGKTWDPILDSSISGLHFFNPLKVALDDLKESIASIERKAVEERTSVKKSNLATYSAPERMPDISHSTNINHLTNQVYQMLERKIRVERERRGL